jgi:hypothetical protein
MEINVYAIMELSRTVKVIANSAVICARGVSKDLTTAQLASQALKRYLLY